MQRARIRVLELEIKYYEDEKFSTVVELEQEFRRLNCLSEPCSLFLFGKPLSFQMAWRIENNLPIVSY